MNLNGYAQIVFYFAVLLGLSLPLGIFMARVYEGKNVWLNRWGAPFERFIYRICGVDAGTEMRWTRYAWTLLLFNFLGFLVVYGLQRLQAHLPLDIQAFGAVTPDSSFNTAISFATNTNWQGYAGESTMSYLTQMAGLAVQNFLSAATGMCVAVALIRGFARHTAETIGNFWVDLTRSTLYILLPLSLILAVALVGQGVVQNFRAYESVTLTQPITYQAPVTDSAGNPVKDAQGKPVTKAATQTTQDLPMGPAASQIAIKQLGTNGGGYFNANSAHPYENPTPLSNFLEMLAILLISGGLCITFGEMVGDRRQGWAILMSMTVLLVMFLALAVYAEQKGNPGFTALGVDQQASALQAGGNMEGKETRFGIANSTLWAAATTGASNGSVNSMHDSYTPLGGMAPLLLIQLGEVVFGGVGTGLYTMLAFALMAVFIAGLMVGRTPEYLGKKIESFEMKMVSIVILVTPLLVLVGTAVAVMLPAGQAGPLNPGAHGFSEILYAFSSAANNNGSAFAGIGANTPFYNYALGIVMQLGRYWPIVALLAAAGVLARKKRIPPGLGTLPTHTGLFVALLVGTVLLVGALTYVPALALGPLAEHFTMIGLH
ncbi:MAG TPA: potassium-transporting ATPase subunit KdpA [Gammaproteobacteria bacterium]|nr:potassium-transporting ATPase subunit KdpA [Gammaproteobacteria bacterium]